MASWKILAILSTRVMRLTIHLDTRVRPLFRAILVGIFGTSERRRTAASWFRAGQIGCDFRRAYNVIASVGRKAQELATTVLLDVENSLASADDQEMTFALDDTPCERYGPKVEGAGLHHNPTPGPAPRKPFVSNYLHYNWHWGNGELGNNGIHMLDLCRWGLGVDFPIRVTSSGGRYRFQDDQETPDTHMVGFEFEGGKSIAWEGLICVQMPNGQPADVIFYGEQGTLAIRGNGWTIHDLKGKELKKSGAGKTNDSTHFSNFLDAIRGTAKSNSEIEEGHRSTLLCHLGNIAHRTGRALKCDPKDGRILNDKAALAYWTREYEKGWEPKV